MNSTSLSAYFILLFPLMSKEDVIKTSAKSGHKPGIVGFIQGSLRNNRKRKRSSLERDET